MDVITGTQIPLLPPPLPPLSDWSSTQGHILTGGGRLGHLAVKGRDFVSSDLPHTIKSQGLPTSRSVFRKWITQGKRSRACVGAWSRPLFAGGWSESTAADTAVFNLQTPSIFIDLRFPHALADKAMPSAAAGGLHACSLDQLRDLAQQHCFAGYSLVDQNDVSPLRNKPPNNRLEKVLDSDNGGGGGDGDGRGGAVEAGLAVCTRHHAIDWNYHPSFPRAQPNRWCIEPHPSGDGRSFKEWGVTQDPRNGQAVYFERWQLLQGGAHNDSKYSKSIRSSAPKNGVATTETPDTNTAATVAAAAAAAAAAQGPCLALRRIAGADVDRDAFLVVVGDHFAYARDRAHPMPSFSYAERGGCAALAQAAHAQGDRQALLALLDLEGSYGRISTGWRIEKSTHPWRQGQQLIESGQVQLVPKTSAGAAAATTPISHIEWADASWEVLECEHDLDQLAALFGTTATEGRSMPPLSRL
eukprot:UC1_evm1s2045